MKPEIVARLLNDRQAVADRLLALKQIFPRAGMTTPSCQPKNKMQHIQPDETTSGMVPFADCGKMLVKELGLMSESIESLTQRAEALRDFLPTVDIDRLVQVLPVTSVCSDLAHIALTVCGC